MDRWKDLLVPPALGTAGVLCLLWGVNVVDTRARNTPPYKGVLLRVPHRGGK